MLRSTSLVLLLACAEPLSAPEADSGELARGAAGVEVCNGLDDDGDDRVDEGIDVDNDGISDCDEDPCAVDDPTLWFSTDARELGWYNPTTGVVRKVGTMVGDVRDIGFGPDGRLWGNTVDGRIVEVNEVTANTKIRGQIPSRAGDSMGASGRGYLATTNGSALMLSQVGPTSPWQALSARTMPSGPLGVPEGRDTAWHAGKLYVSVQGARGATLQQYRVAADGQSLNGVTPANWVRRRAWSGITSRADGSFWGVDGTRFERINLTNGAAAPQIDLAAMPVQGGRFTGTPNGLTSRTAWCGDRDEVCNGRDDDFDGAVDEGFDADQDGIADCFDVELCNGEDDDGDGSVDGGFPDGDGDGVADCVDFEVCNGDDDDGDGEADEGFDADNDGISDCDEDPCDVADPVVWVYSRDGSGACLFEAVNTFFGTRQSWAWPASAPACELTSIAIGDDGGMFGARSRGGEWETVRVEPTLGLTSPVVYPGGGVGLVGGVDGALWTIDGLMMTRLDAPGSRTLTSFGDKYDLAWSDGAPVTVDVNMAMVHGSVNAPMLPPLHTPARYDGGVASLPDGRMFAVVQANQLIEVARHGDPRSPTRALGGADHPAALDLAAWGDVCQSQVDVCNGLDDDGDGRIDEGQPDTDRDGIADCQDVETCDGLDNDGDGQSDEDFYDDEFFSDADGDGVLDCREMEACDGVDNDGDGRVDEHSPDADADGLADCVDPELCNGLDDDGDDLADEGFPDTDGDEIADCVDIEVCNGDDDDGDGEADEGFDLDDDGLPDCEEHACEVDARVLWALSGAWGAPCRYDRVDVDTGDIQSWSYAANHPACAVSGLALGADGGLWGLRGLPTGDQDVVRVDPATGAVSAPVFGGIGAGIAAGPGGGLWAVDESNGVIQRLDAPGAIPLPPSSTGRDLAWVDGRPLLAGLYTTYRLTATGLEFWLPRVFGVASPFGGLAVAGGGDVYLGWQQRLYPAAPGGSASSASQIVLPGPANQPVRDLAGLGDACGALVDVCDGADDDHDGQVDEGHPDTDGDGLADCVDVETCDGADNDGDGAIDEGFSGDSDADGTLDCADVEACDGVDNDGDGALDDGFPDGDGDGAADCVDTELCNGDDDDGDGQIDEGHDIDEDGTPDCEEHPCDVDDPTVWMVRFVGGAAASPAPLTIIFERLDVRTGVVVASRSFVWVSPADFSPLTRFSTISAGLDGALYGMGYVAPTGYAVARLDLDAGVAPLLAPTRLGTGPGMVGDHTGDFWFHAVDVVSGRGTWTPRLGAQSLQGLGDLAWWDGRLVLATNRGVVSVDVSQPPGVVQASVLSPTFAWGLASADGALIVAEPAGAGTNVLRLDPATGVSTLITTVATNVYDLASFSDICASIVDVCNGIDDDHDELVDEGAPDTDGDGVADCVDEEGCDGLDNDGDGFVDEGMPDTDGDGTADCVDVEVCNGVDDDGNGLVDDADSDSDGDGILDCDDVEACDDVDNDGDGLNNEGYDLDEDGISDCFESPCDVTDPTWWYSTVDGVITRVNPASGQRWTIGPTWPDLTDVAWAADGVLYGVTAAGELVSIDPVTGEGTFDRHIGAGALGLGADSDGNLWIGYDDRIKRVNLFDGGTDSWDGLGADVHDLTMLNGGPEAVVFNAGIGKSLILPFVPASGSFGSPYYLDNSVWTGLIPGLPGGVAVSIFQISRYVNPTFGAMSQGPAIGAPNTTGAASRVDACTVR